MAEPIAEKIDSIAQQFGWDRWLTKANPFLLILGIIGITVALGPIMLRHEDAYSDIWTYAMMPAGEAMYHGESLGQAYAYPPLLAMLTVPFTFLRGEGPRIAWYLVNVAACLYAIGSCWRLTSERGWLASRWSDSLVLGLACLLVGRFVISPMEVRQTDMVIFAVLVAGIVRCHREQWIAGSILIGLSAGMKCTPLLFAPMLAIQGRWKTACLVVVTAVTANVVPDILFPRTNGSSYLVEWYDGHLSPLRSKVVGEWKSDVLLNQSLAGLSNRIVRFRPESWTVDVDRRIDSTSALTARLGTLAFVGVLVVGTLFARWRPPRTSFELQSESSEFLLDAGATLCLMLLLSPMTSKAHYVTLLLPTLSYVRKLLESRQLGLWLVLPILLITGPLNAKGIVGKRIGEILLLVGLPTFFAIALLVSIWIVGRSTLARRVSKEEMPRQDQLAA